MRVLIAIVVCLLSCDAAVAEVVLTGDTSRPEMSTFIPGETITLTFTVNGLTGADRGVRLLINIKDEHGKSIRTREIPVQADASGSWTTSIAAPNSKLGFYRVNARLSNGVQLEKLGSRQAGYLTYCIVPDPKLRVLYDSKDTRFGIVGGFSSKVNVCPYLGIRWMLGGYAWRYSEPDRPGQFAEKRAAGTAPKLASPVSDPSSWRFYHIATLYQVPAWAVIPETRTYVSGALTPEGEKAWDSYCRQAAKAFIEDDPNSEEHIYQITWEPVAPWGYKGTDDQLIRIHQIAYPALHESDPKAVVISPAGAGITDNATDWDARLLEKGLGKYIDAYCIHPYHPIPPEPENMVRHVRRLMEIVRRGVGRDIPMIGTEQGYATKDDPSKELDQARGLLRQNLIMLGEGFRFNLGFYNADFPSEPGFGYYYNLNPRIPHGTDKVSPKPIVPAYAAQSFFIEGHKSVGAIEWLGETTLGYAFVRKDDVVLALWDYGDKPRRVSVPVGAKQVDVYDWMGNKRSVSSPNGILDLTLTPEPTYVKGASALLWNSGKKPITTAVLLPVLPAGPQHACNRQDHRGGGQARAQDRQHRARPSPGHDQGREADRRDRQVGYARPGDPERVQAGHVSGDGDAQGQDRIGRSDGRRRQGRPVCPDPERGPGRRSLCGHRNHKRTARLSDIRHGNGGDEGRSGQPVLSRASRSLRTARRRSSSRATAEASIRARPTSLLSPRSRPGWSSARRNSEWTFSRLRG